MATQADATIDTHLHPKQMAAFNSEATEILYGGAAGGGKSHLMRIAAIIWCSEIPGLQVYLFRRIRDDLIKNHMEGPNGFRSVLAGWVECGFVTIVEDEIRFWNGSKIYLCHCKDEKDRFKYQGAEIHLLLVDELTHFTDKIYRFLRNRVRMVGIAIPEKYKGRFPRIICGANPGGIGHQFVKMTFIDGQQPMKVYQAANSEGGMLRQFIPARLEDNPSMEENDPGYDARLHGLGSESLVRAMRHGDWDIIDGAFFDNFRQDRHVIKPFAIPEEWTRFRAGDWGSARPFSFGWYAIASDDYEASPGVIIPRGALVRYREWYGVSTDKEGKFVPNQGVKMTADAVGLGILQRERGDKITYGVLDPAAFAKDGGPSIRERISKATGHKVLFRPADNKRVTARGAMGGWDQMRSRLDGDEDGRPMLFFFDTCIHAIRTIPALQHDEDKPEDLNTDMEDHVADEVRYACMSRPYLRVVRDKPKQQEITFQADEKTGVIKSNLTFAELIKRQERRRRA
ncbi:terminase [Rhizobium lentis]|uniref:Terminase n=2 Tax=Rhizobium lentis TaxID=1138194 RepID=A0ABS7ID45_9HYPH|nr:terminase [Rhizobium lentis]